LALLLGWLALLVTGDVLAAGVAPGDAVARFDAANKLYEQGKFREAAAAYESILKAGVASPALYFNLGNALFKSAQIGRALVAYRQAEQLAPRDPDVRANLRFARNQVSGPAWLPGRLERWVGRLSLNEWTALTAGSFWLTFLALAAAQLRPALARAGRQVAILAAAGTVFFGTGLGLALANQVARETAVVIAREVTVRNGPFAESPEAFTVHDGAELRVLDRKDDWLQVTDGRRRPGWLQRDAVAVVNGF
jgi:tetratricopeptide (TPR) repeat protein